MRDQDILFPLAIETEPLIPSPFRLAGRLLSCYAGKRGVFSEMLRTLHFFSVNVLVLMTC
jgi:hypothetical protein